MEAEKVFARALVLGQESVGTQIFSLLSTSSHTMFSSVIFRTLRIKATAFVRLTLERF